MTLGFVDDQVAQSDQETTQIITKTDERDTTPNNTKQNKGHVDNSDNINESNSMNTSLQSNATNSPGRKVEITDSMMKEEIDGQTDESTEQEQIQAMEEMEKTTTQTSRFERLQVLLDRSEVYAKYLLERITAREEADKKKKEADEKKQQKKDETLRKQKEEIKGDPTKDNISKESVRKSGRSRPEKVPSETESIKQSKKKQAKLSEVSAGKKRKQSEVNVEEYYDKKDLEERVKRQKTDVQAKSESQTLNASKTSKVDTFSHEVNGEKVSDRQPVLLTGGIMRPYQLDGMDWMRGLFEYGINGILADEMGLGKTLQCIGLISTLIEQNVVGPYLIAAPLSTLPNWMSEFKKFAPEIRTILYHGSIPEREEIRKRMFRLKRYSHDLKSLPVVISSYEILMRDRIHLAGKIEWKYLIVDEGHRIKNLNCKLIKELKLYKTANRLLLTGTPLQNNLAELWSLLNFLLPDIFDDLNSFQNWFDFGAEDDGNWNQKVIAQEKEASVLKTLHSILTPFLLRRLKTDVDLSIPPKKEIIVYAPLTETQEEYYKTTLDRTIFDIIEKKHKEDEPVEQELNLSGRPKRKSTGFVKYKYDADSEEFDLDKLTAEYEQMEQMKLERLEELEKSSNKKAILNIRLQNILMQLRKCCNHPYLLEFPIIPGTKDLRIDEDLVKCSGKMLLIDRMLPELKKLGHKVLIFSQMVQMLEILQDFCNIRGYNYSRLDGTMNFKERQAQIDQFNDDPEVFIFLLSTRAGGLGLNLMTADTCIIYDSDWNPQVDLQAQDRCHRIGQQKPVVIYRLVTRNTVDQRIIERAAGKRKLEKMVIHKNGFKGQGKSTVMTPQELLNLLESSDHSGEIDSSTVISQDHLMQLLDRSDLLKEMEQSKKEKEELEKIDERKSSEANEPSTSKKESISSSVTLDNSPCKAFKVVEQTTTDDIIF